MGLFRRFLEELWARFPVFLKENLPQNPLKCEYFLPQVVNAQLADGSATVQVLPCEESWYGVTYQEDLDTVRQAIERMEREGTYPETLVGMRQPPHTT